MRAPSEPVTRGRLRLVEIAHRNVAALLDPPESNKAFEFMFEAMPDIIAALRIALDTLRKIEAGDRSSDVDLAANALDAIQGEDHEW